MKEGEVDSKRADRALLLGYLKKYRKIVGLGALGLILVNITLVFPPLIVKVVIDGFIQGITPQEVLLWSLAYLALSVLQAGLRYLWTSQLLTGSALVEQDLRNQIFNQLLSADFAELSQQRSGEVMALVSNDTVACKSLFDGGMIVFFDAFLVLLTTPIVMYLLSAELTWWTLAVFPLIPLLVRVNETKIRTRFKFVQESFSNLMGFAQESITGLRIIRSFACEERFSKRFIEEGQQYLNKSLKLALVESALAPVLELIVVISTLILFLKGGDMILAGSLSVGSFVAFNRYLQQLRWPAQAFGISFSIYQRALSSAGRINRFLSLKTSAAGGVASRGMPSTKLIASASSAPLLELRQLYFAYPQSDSTDTPKWVLKDLNLKVQAGERIALLGPVGSGKSSLAILLAGLREPQTGEILIHGRSIKSLSGAELKQMILLIPQEAFLFSGTVRRNLRLALPDQPNSSATMEIEQLIDACQKAAIHEEIAALPEQYDTVLGERGVTVSGGQRQRLTIARALLDPGQILIFDDSLSAVDNSTEQAILNALAEEDRRVTKIFITQRLSTVNRADRIIILDQGEIVADGTAEECLSNPWFRRFFLSSESSSQECE